MKLDTDDWRAVLDRAEAAVSALAELPTSSGAGQAHGRQAAEAMQELRRMLTDSARAAGAGTFDLNRMEVLGHLAGGIAHEINNWFFVIRGFSGLARFDLAADHPLTDNLDQIDEAVDRAEGLTRMVLECSHPLGDGILSVRIHPLVKEGLKAMRGSLPESIRVHQAVATDAAPVLVEPIGFYCVVLALLRFAVDRLSAAPGLLWVALKEIEPEERGGDASVVLTVGSAVGDDPEELGRRFESDGPVVAGPPTGNDSVFAGIDETIKGFGGELRHRSTDGGCLSVEVVLSTAAEPAIR